MAITDHDRVHFLDTVNRLSEIGAAPVVLYGAGRVARALRPTVGTPPGSVIGIIDDNPATHGQTCAGLPVMSLETATARGPKAVIITCEGAAQDAVWARRDRLRAAGMRVFTCPARFAGKPWDQCLIEQWEVSEADARGLNVSYGFDYPPRRHVAEPRMVELLRRHLPAGGTACEIGSGTGLIAEHLLPHAGRYHCVDFSARLLHEVIEHRFFAMRDRLRLHHDESARLEGVADASVDLVLSFDVFVHFKQDLVHQFLASFKRVLKPGGCAILHFLKWGPEAIGVWERAMASWNVGRPDPMGYNSPEDVRSSCTALGLKAQEIELPVGPGRWWAKITRS